MVAFDRQSLKDRLEKVGPLCRTLFALCCAERLFPLYKAFSEKSAQGTAGDLRSTLDQLWESALRKQTGGKQSFLDEYESLIPGEDAEWTPLNPLAENAVAALAYACQCQLTEETDNAAWAAVQDYEAVDYIAHTLEGIDFKGPEAETAILKNEYVQSEIQRQLRDLAELESIPHDGRGIEKVVKVVQNRAKSEGVLLVPVVSVLCK